jgi:nucleoside-diphosphate-sugar epimerase
VLVTGDGTSIWTLTRSEDFAKPFVKLFGNKAAYGEDFHITGDVGFTWDAIYDSLAKGLGVKANIVHVPTETVIRYKPDWAGPLLGDKTWTVLFDNSKVKRVAGDFSCETNLEKILSEPIRFFKKRLAAKVPYNAEFEPLLDLMMADQQALGTQ